MMDKSLQSYEQNFTSWTDDVPTCAESGVGSCCNEVYRQDGRRVGLHEYEDRSFRLVPPPSLNSSKFSLYFAMACNLL